MGELNGAAGHLPIKSVKNLYGIVFALSLNFETRCVKFLYFRLFILAAFVFLLPACSFFIAERSVAGVDDSATFIVEQIKGQVVATRVNGLPEEFQVSYTACFRDFIHQDNTLQNSLFNIHFFEEPAIRENLKLPSVLGEEGKSLQTSVLNIIPEQGKANQNRPAKPVEKECSKSSFFLFSDSKASCISIRTDAAGCLNWTEVYPHRPIDQSVWFRYERAFEGTGVHKGQTFVPLAINPWLSTELSGSTSHIHQLVDLRYYSAKQKLISLKKSDVPQCRFCSSNKNKQDCDICKRKVKSLSSVMKDFEQNTNRPRLWLHKVDSQISQERIIINKTDITKQELQLLDRFKVCRPHTKEQQECDPPGRFFKVRLKLPLQIHVKNYRNEDNYPLLTRGQYAVQAYLFLKGDKGGHTLLHREMDFIHSTITGGKDAHLKSEFYLHLPYEHYGLPAFLALKVKAQGELKNFFLPFEGVFAFPGHFKEVIGRNTLDLESSSVAFYKKSKSTNSLIANYKLKGSWNKEQQTEGFRKAGWDIQLRRLRFSEISIDENKCPTAVDQWVRYVGEVCIVDPLTKQVVSNTDITVQRQDIFFKPSGRTEEGEAVLLPKSQRKVSDYKNKKQKDGNWYNTNGDLITKGKWYNTSGDVITKKDFHTSDTSGCLQWVDELPHKWYNKEKYFVRKMIFSKPEWGFEGERVIAINPWHWGFVFFQDITQLGYSDIRTTEQAKRAEPPQIVLHDFRSVFVDPIYTIDRFLGINLFQNLLLLFRIRIDRPDNITAGFGGQRPSSQDARRGYYFLRSILVKSHVEEQGSKGNQVINHEQFREQHQERQDWNSQTGQTLGRNEQQIGQMMNTNLEYITHFDTYVQIRDSMVNAYINTFFNLDQFIFIGSNNRLIVQLLPTDPKYYEYHDNSCEVNPARSVFKPFTEHELISKPFMGTFVPGDIRNWNIFRILSEKVNLSISKETKNMISLEDMNLDHFIEKGRQDSSEHELFTKLHSQLFVATGDWSSKSRQEIQTLRAVYHALYSVMDSFLKSPLPANDSSFLEPFHHFNIKKNRLIELLDNAMTKVSNILKGATNNKYKTMFQIHESLFNKAVSYLNDSSAKPAELHAEIKNIKNSFHRLITDILSIPLSLKEGPLPKNQKASRYFTEKSFPKEPNEWSGFNMNQFAKSEGLKVITMDDKPLVKDFLADLNNSAKNHNSYHNTYNQDIERLIKNRQNSAFAYIDKKIDKKALADDWQKHHENKIKTQQAEHQHLWNNFELLQQNNYQTISDFHALRKKIQTMYLPEMSHTWLAEILEHGVHSGTKETPEVMTFFHSLCGFWFDKFYTKYLEIEQLKTIYLNYMEHFRYYKGTLEHLSDKDGAFEQYQDLYKAMENFGLAPIDKDFLTQDYESHNSPFQTPVGFLKRLFSSESSNEETLKPVTRILYYSLLPSSLEQQLFIQSDMRMRMGSMITSSQNTFFKNFSLNSYRHPFFTCLGNPFEFFHIEKKIIVGEIGSGYSDLKYEYGTAKSYTIQQSFDYAYSAQWSMSRSFSTKLGTGFGFFGSMEKVINPLNVVNPVFSFSGIRLDSDWSTSRSDADSNRRQQSLRLADESLYLQLNHSAISIRLKNFRHCLVLRAKNQSFDGYESYHVWRKELAENFIYRIPYIKSGLMLCSKDIKDDELQNPFYITEDYFYMYQNLGEKGQFQNPLSFRNRPFVMSVRGRTEMQKLRFLTHAFVEPNKREGIEDYNPYQPMTNIYNAIPKPADSTRKMIQQVKLWDKTGFYPGVYDVTYDEGHYFFKNPQLEEKGMVEKLGGYFHRNNPFPYVRFDETLPLPERGDSN